MLPLQVARSVGCGTTSPNTRGMSRTKSIFLTGWCMLSPHCSISCIQLSFLFDISEEAASCFWIKETSAGKRDNAWLVEWSMWNDGRRSQKRDNSCKVRFDISQWFVSLDWTIALFCAFYDTDRNVYKPGNSIYKSRQLFQAYFVSLKILKISPFIWHLKQVLSYYKQTGHRTVLLDHRWQVVIGFRKFGRAFRTLFHVMFLLNLSVAIHTIR